MTRRLQVAGSALVLLWAGLALAAGPRLLAEFAATQRVDRGELLMLPGVGLRPDSRLQVAVPGRSGFVTPQLDSPWPHGIVVEMPQVVESSVPLELRLAGAGQQQALRFNLPRPAWFSPVTLPAASAGSPQSRELWVTGSALDDGDTGPELRLRGPRDLAIREPTIRRGEYLVYRLPQTLMPGRYTVAIAARSGRVETISSMALSIEEPRAAAATLELRDARFGACAPDDGRDDAECLRRALRFAATVQGAEIRLAPGIWRLRLDPAQGSLELPAGTSLRGVAGRTTVELDWQAEGSPAGALRLLGSNVVSGLRFVDVAELSARSAPRAALMLGRPWQSATAGAPALRDIVIVDNEFDGVYRAVADAGLPLERLHIQGNRFAAFETALQLGGDRFRTDGRFRLVDSVIADNLFEPGGLLDEASARGPVASEIGGSLRLRFSGNVAAIPRSGADKATPGWRAAFFWHLQDSQEDLLIARNVAQCPGSLIGDGEGIALDNNAATTAYPGSARVVAAERGYLILEGALQRRQNDRDLPRENPYAGHWLQIVAGDGRGQLRRVLAHAPAASPGHERFLLEGEIPEVTPGALAIVTRAFVRPRILDNHVDQRGALCGRRNLSGPRGGAISLWGNSVDAAIARNVVDEGDGVVVNHSWSSAKPCRDCGQMLILQWRPRIELNAVLGENDPGSNCSHSGIELRHGASPARDDIPPPLGFGALISHNAVAGADGVFSGSIALPLTWHAGPSTHREPLVDGYIVQGNSIEALAAEPARGRCGPARTRVPLFVAPGHSVGNGWWRNNSCVLAQEAAPCAAP